MIEVVKNKYNIIRKIGQGGMAQIFLGTEKNSDNKIAIKILEPSFQNDIIKKKRFHHEINIMKKVDSPFVAKLLHAEMTADYSYIVMEYIDGYILKDYITKYSRLTVDQAVDFCKQLALGFTEIHNHNIIHRDIKSQNVMVGSNHRLKIIDFGIALDDESERLTKTDMLIGSPQYVSPELVRQEAPSRHSDIYALGVLLFEMLSGNVPFHGKSALETLKKQQDMPVPRITKTFPNVPQPVENIIIKATAKNIEHRYDDMYEMYVDLKSCLSKERQTEPLLNLEHKPKRNIINIINSRWAIVTIILLLVTILAAIITLIVVGDL